MSIEQHKKQESQKELRAAAEKKAALLQKTNLQIMANPGAFREQVGEVFDSIIRAVWHLTE